MSVHALKEPKNIIRYVIFLSLKDSINCLLTWNIALLLTFGKLFIGKKTDMSLKRVFLTQMIIMLMIDGISGKYSRLILFFVVKSHFMNRMSYYELLM